MAFTFAHSDFMPCDRCGASLASGEREAHVCDAERVLDYRLFQLRDEVAGLDDAIGRYLESPQGRFAQWVAARERHSP